VPNQRGKYEKHYQALEELQVEHPNTPIVTTYDVFSSLHTKSAYMTIGECFEKQLLCIDGIHPAQVATIRKKFRTMGELWAALKLELESAASVAGISSPKHHKNPEMVLEGLGQGRGTISPEISKKIYHLFVDNSYDDSVE
jgi:hypothetical protein